MEYTFLDLVRMTARESGTVPSELPLTTQGETGRLGNIVKWVNTAWNNIQISRANWLWMYDTFQAETVPGLASYSPLQLGITRFDHFIADRRSMTIQKKDLARSDEQFIPYIDRDHYKYFYGIGAQEPGRPSCYHVSHDGQLFLGPMPDDEYIIRGEYYKSPQVLVNDDDLPEVPRKHRPIIAWQALILLSQYDEGQLAVAFARMNYQNHFQELLRDELPQVRFALGTLR